jgi:hypothetical protein
MSICCLECGCYKDCHPEPEHKRGVKIKYNDPVHEAWRISSRDSYMKRKAKNVGVEK